MQSNSPVWVWKQGGLTRTVIAAGSPAYCSRFTGFTGQARLKDSRRQRKLAPDSHYCQTWWWSFALSPPEAEFAIAGLHHHMTTTRDQPDAATAWKRRDPKEPTPA